MISRRYWKSFIWGHLKKNEYKDIQTYCMFIGYQRSGHSYIGAILDAHPNTAIGMEVDALNLVQLGYKKNQLYYCLANNARIFNQILKNVWTGYSYAVPGGSQGKYKSLKVIGDKKGGKSTLRLGDNPELYTKLSVLTGIPVKIVHVIRNPFDNISTMCLRFKEKGNDLTLSEFRKKINMYFKKVEINQSLKYDNKFSILDIYHEDFIKNPKKLLSELLDFIGLHNDDNFIDKCAATAYQQPHKSRNKLDWPDELKTYVSEKIKQYSYLKHYTFND